jgi:hypothetical protein
MTDATYSVSFGAVSFDQTSTTYRLVEAGPADIKWRRTPIVAPFVAGDADLSAVQDVSSYRLVIRCVGGGSNAGTLANALKAAAAVPTTLVVVLTGASETYAAKAADINQGAQFEDLYNNLRVVTLTFPTQPFPT